MRWLEPRQGRAGLLGLAGDLARFRLDRFDVPLHPGVLLAGPLDVLLARQALGQAHLHRARELSDLLLEGRELGSERRDLGLPCLDNRREPLHLRLELTELPLAGQERVLRLARRPGHRRRGGGRSGRGLPRPA